MLGMSGWVVGAVGVILCFAGVASLSLAVLVSAFAVVWLLADVWKRHQRPQHVNLSIRHDPYVWSPSCPRYPAP